MYNKEQAQGLWRKAQGGKIFSGKRCRDSASKAQRHKREDGSERINLNNVGILEPLWQNTCLVRKG
jgi:hypothetical protein